MKCEHCGYDWFVRQELVKIDVGMIGGQTRRVAERFRCVNCDRVRQPLPVSSVTYEEVGGIGHARVVPRECADAGS